MGTRPRVLLGKIQYGEALGLQMARIPPESRPLLSSLPLYSHISHVHLPYKTTSELITWSTEQSRIRPPDGQQANIRRRLFLSEISTPKDVPRKQDHTSKHNLIPTENSRLIIIIIEQMGLICSEGPASILDSESS